MTISLHSARKSIALTAAIAAASLLSAAPGWAGSLVLVGGSLAPAADGDPNSNAIYQTIIDRAGGVANAKIGIISAGYETALDAEDVASSYIQDFQDLGVTDVEWIPLHPENFTTARNDPALAAQISSYTGFFFAGGDQSLITRTFFDEQLDGTRTPSLAFDALRDRFDAGAVIAGTSAGTAVQTSSPMITEGESYESILNGPNRLVGQPPLVDDLYYNPLGGLGFFNYGITDSHFSERGRQGRVIRLASDLDVSTVYGVDENTALVVTDPDTADVNFSVIGQGGVFITDLTQATVNTDQGWAIDGVRASYLTDGDQFDPLTGTATFAPGKLSLVGREQLDTVAPEADIFSSLKPEPPDGQGRANPRAFTDLAIDLFNSRATTATGQSFETDPFPYGVTLTKGADAEGFYNPGTGDYAFENLEVAIAPVPEPGLVGGLLVMGAIGAGTRLKRRQT